MTVVRTLLAVVLGVAGGAKLADPAASRRAVGQVGLPRGAVPPVAAALPVAELGVAGLLLAGPGPAAGLASVVLVSLFNLAVAARLLRGHDGDCGCFGRVRRGSVGMRTLARNAVLAAGAVLVWSAATRGLAPRPLDLARVVRLFV